MAPSMPPSAFGAVATLVAAAIRPVDSSSWEYIPPLYACSPEISGCTSPNHECLANPNHPQMTNDGECAACSRGQTYWPCDVDGLCYCWDKSRPKIPPAPSTRVYNSGQGLEVSKVDPCSILTPEIFEALAPEARAPYSYAGFCTAVRKYNENHPDEGFCNMGSVEQQKSELAAFLGNSLHESDEFRAGREYLQCADRIDMGGEAYCRPCDAGSFDWDLMKCPAEASLASEGRAFNSYCQSNLLPPEGCECDDVYERAAEGPMAGYVKADQVYFGRGSIQLSWNYNYIRASVALTGASQTFCQRPDLVATQPEYAWGAGLYYWMENIKNDKTCHQSVLLNEEFGETLDNINGGLECPADDHGWHGQAIILRLNRYCRAATAIGVENLLSLRGCMDMEKRMKQCLEEGTCRHCKVWESKMEFLKDNDADVEEEEDDTQDIGGCGKKNPKKCPGYVEPSNNDATSEGANDAKTDESDVDNDKGATDVASESNQSNEQSAEKRPQPCSGKPCNVPDHFEFCRASSGACGAGSKFCNSMSTWTSSCEAEDSTDATTKVDGSHPPPLRTRRPTAQPSAGPTKPLPSAASQFGIIPVPNTKPGNANSGSSSVVSQANQFASMTHSKGKSNSDDREDDMTNFAMTKLEHPPTESPVDAPDRVPPTRPPTRLPTKEPTAPPKKVTDSAPSASYYSQLDNDFFQFSPMDDVTISRSQPVTNFGSEPTIIVDMLEGDAALLRFDLSVVGDRSIRSAILRLTPRSSNSADGNDAYAEGLVYYIQPTVNGWTENGVTYASTPKANGILFASVATSFVELDITKAASNHIISFRIVGLDPSRKEFHSKESSALDKAPVLFLKVGGSNEEADTPATNNVISPIKEDAHSGDNDKVTIGKESNGPKDSITVASSSLTGRSISGHIWLDRNGDGIKDSNEPGLRGILVDMFQCSDDKWLEGTRTAAGGDYIFEKLPQGEYYVVATAASDEYGFTQRLASTTGMEHIRVSDVDPITGSGDCVDLTGTQLLSATFNVGVVKTSSMPNNSVDSAPESKEEVDYNCRGKPCAPGEDGEEYCRSKHNFCGAGPDYCNEQSQWMAKCGTPMPTHRPSTSPTTSEPTVSPTTEPPTFLHDPNIHCAGESCKEGEGWCRSELGYCGVGPLYCNVYSSWVPDCDNEESEGAVDGDYPTGTKSSSESSTTSYSPTPFEMVSEPTKNDMLNPLPRPTLPHITTPKQSDIGGGSNHKFDQYTIQTDVSDDDEEKKTSDDQSPGDDTPWYVRYADVKPMARNVGFKSFSAWSVVFLYTTIVVLQLGLE